MVHRSTKSSSLKWFLLGIIIIATIVFVVCKIILKDNQTNYQSASENAEITEENAPPSLINLQPTIDAWIATLDSKAGVMIYDLDNQQIVAEHNSEQIFSTASIYKLFVVYAGYLEIANGNLNPNDILFSSYTVSSCLDLAIRESNSSCAESLQAKIGRTKIDQYVNEWGMTDTRVSGLQSTPNDVFKIMQKFYEHKELSNETWAIIADSFLNQPPTSNGLCDGPCNWRQGLPSGFSIAKIYNKVGWEHSASSLTLWNVYNDAAIIEFPEQENSPARHYIIVAMVTNTESSKLSELGQSIEQAILDSPSN